MRYYYLILLSCILGLAVTITLADERQVEPLTLQWSPNGLWIARGYTDGTISLTSLSSANTTVELKFDSSRSISTITWSADSSRLAASVRGTGQIFIWDVTNSSLLQILQGDVPFNDGGTHLAWNPKQNILASATVEGDGGMFVRFWDTQTYAQIGVSGNYIVPNFMKWNPNGSILAVTDAAYGLMLYDTFVGENIFPRGEAPGISYVDWSPDGTQIVAVEYTSRAEMENRVARYEIDSWVTILDANTLKEVAQITESVHNAMGPVLWSPDGQRIALLSPDQAKIVDSVSGMVLEQYPLPSYSFNVGWSPFGGRLALADSLIDSPLSQDIQIVVPAPSPELVKTIQIECVPESIISNLPIAETALTVAIDATSYINAVRTNPSIPVGCAADLIAVAEALQVEQKGE